MARISALPHASNLDGSEDVPIVKDGITQRAGLAPLVEAASQPILDRAESAAAAAEAFYGRPYASIADGLAATATGQSFAVNNGDGTTTIYLHSADGAAILPRTVATTAYLASDAGAGRIGFRQTGAAASITVEKKLLLIVNVDDYDAVGDGETPDDSAFSAALAAAIYVQMSAKPYFLAEPLLVPSNRTLFGAGKCGWEPYTAGSFPDMSKSQIVVDGTLAFNCSGTNNVTVRGLSVRAKGGLQSAYAAAPGFQPGAIGFDITSASAFDLSDCAFMGLEVGVTANQGSGSTCQMPQFDDWLASDCQTVFKFGNRASSAYTSRDVRIGRCVVALHCGTIIEGHHCDGIRVENTRLFQCTGNSIYLRACNFPSIIGTTLFETSGVGFVIEDCTNVVATGLVAVRAGAYAMAAPYPQIAAIQITGCTTVEIGGIIERPAGTALDLTDSSGVIVKLAVSTPFWTTGAATNSLGAINLIRCGPTVIDAAITGTGHWIDVAADWYSQPNLQGAVSGELRAGVLRAYNLRRRGIYTAVTTEDIYVSAGGITDVAATLRRILVPAGKVMRSRSLQQTSLTVQVQTVVAGEAVRWSPTNEPEAGDTISTEDLVVFDNSAGPSRYVDIPLRFRNPSDADLTIPAGHEIRLSAAFVDG